MSRGLGVGQRGVAVAVFAAALIGAPGALAAVPATYTVNGVADGNPGTCASPVGTTESCTTLRAAVNAADDNEGDPTITLGAGRYVLGGTGGTSSELDIYEPMTITGAGPSKTTIVQTDSGYAVASVDASGPGAVIENVEVTGGTASGIGNEETLRLSNDLIDHNTDDEPASAATDDGESADGGGIGNSGTLTIDHSTVTENTATGGTGGPSSGATPAGSGGAAYGGAIDNGGTLTVTDSTISDNIARGGAGGNTVNGTAGGADVAYGGGIEAQGDTVLDGDTISDNHVFGGAGGDATGTGTPGSAQSGYGGGIDLSGNTATTAYKIVNTTITGNTAPGGSGGTSNDHGTGSAGDGFGGGVSFYQEGKGTFASDTLVDNTALDGGGNLFMTGLFETPSEQSLTIGDSIIASGAQQVIDDNCRFDSSPDVIDTGLNLEDSGAGKSECGFTSADDRLVSSGTAGVSTTLANNGGPTETLALLAASPALGAGGACKDPTNSGAELLTDQRGEPRPASGPCDIGAFQVQPVTQGTANVTGTAEIGGTLVCTPSGFGVDVSDYTYGWLLSNGSAVKGATGDSLKLTNADGGLVVFCHVTANGVRGEAGATSKGTPIGDYGVPTVKSKKPTVSKSGKFSITITCVGANACSATLKLTVTEHRKAVTVASKSLSIAHGKSTTVTVKLRGSALKLFKKHKRGLRVVATLTYWHLGKIVSPAQKLTLVAAPKHHHHG